MQNKGRKHFKTVLLVTLIVGLVGATSAFAFRGGMGGGMGCGMGGGMGHGMGMRMMMNLTPEQAGQVFDLRQKFMNDTAELRKSMMVKGAELAQLWKAENPDEKSIQAKVKELGALKSQMMEKAVAQRFAMKKIVPGAMGPGGSMGPCPMMGPGKGQCPMGPGQGPKQGASLAPGPDETVAHDAGLDLEMAHNQEPAW
jgi:Spy/CpxP family protein refolding chaperone